MIRTWSPQQNAIFTWFERDVVTAAVTTEINPEGNLIVRARAGTGKTTTIIEGVNRAPEGRILLCAFNKRIAEELTTRLSNPCAQAKTLHAVGYAAVRRYWEGVRIGKNGERAKALTEAACGAQAPDAIKRLVSKLHTLGRETLPHAERGEDLVDLAISFDCEPDDEWKDYGWTVERVAEFAARAMALAAGRKPAEIDFADMIFLPVRNRWLAPTYDLVVVDEAQDMTAAQLEIARGVCRGRICVVGDDRQAIYAFRGADAGSLDRLKRELNASELGLTVTYRCGRRIVDLAAQLVPDFEAGENNPEGDVACLPAEKLPTEVAHGDFVLSRMNAPLVAVALGLLRAGLRARIAGRDIGASLKVIVRRFAKSGGLPRFLERLRAWEEKQVARFTKAERPDKVDAVRDQVEVLVSLAEVATGIPDLETRLDALFTDDGLGQAGVVTCSSIHRAKGLEAERVFVLAGTLRNQNTEELNLQYVAATRAKTVLRWVGGPYVGPMEMT